MAAVVVTMTGEEAQLFRAQQRILEQQLKLAGGYDQASKKSKEEAKAAKEAADLKAKAEKEHQKVIEQGKALTESLYTPQERYNTALATANKLKEEGAIDAETLARRTEQLKTQLDQVTGVTQRATMVEEARLAVVEKNGRVTQTASIALDKYEKSLEELDRQQKSGAISAQELAMRQGQVKKEFQESAGLIEKQGVLAGAVTSQIGQYATAAGAAALAVRAISAAWETVTEEQQKGFDALKKQSESGERQLLQVSGSREEFESMRGQAQQLATSTGVDLNTIQKVLFSGVSEGFRDVVPDIIAANQVISPESAAGVAGQVPALFQGTIGALESVDLTLKAARDSRLNFEQIAQALPGAAEGGAVAKATAEETLATLSVLASRFKSGETAADRIKAFSSKVGIDAGMAATTDEEIAGKVEAEKARVEAANKSLRTKEERVQDLETRLAKAGRGVDKDAIQTQLDRARRDVAEFDRSSLDFVQPERQEGRESLAGIGIVEAVERLNAMSEEDRAGFLKDSQELNTAYLALSEELPLIKQRIAEFQKERESFAAGGGLLRETVGIAQNDEQLTAVRDNSIATQKLEQAYREGRGVEGATADTAVKETERNLLETGSFGARASRSMFDVGGRAARGMIASGADVDTATTVGANTSEAAGVLTFGPLAALVSALASSKQSQDRATEAMNKAAEAQAAAAKQPPRPATPAANSTIDAARIQAGLAAQGS